MALNFLNKQRVAALFVGAAALPNAACTDEEQQLTLKLVDTTVDLIRTVGGSNEDGGDDDLNFEGEKNCVGYDRYGNPYRIACP